MKIGLVAACLMALMVQAHAETIQFHIKNSTGHTLQVRFFSQNRAAWWPGENSGYNQAKKALLNYDLTCNAGEQICYGAWSMPDEKTNWGVGIAGVIKCAACCWHCGDNPGIITLNK